MIARARIGETKRDAAIQKVAHRVTPTPETRAAMLSLFDSVKLFDSIGRYYEAMMIAGHGD